MVIAATIAGANRPEGMAKFAKRKASWLQRFIALEDELPSRDPTETQVARLNGQDTFLALALYCCHAVDVIELV